jgi:1-acyl-sn-glycerol-3-phosphate acyltransferase
LIFFQQLFRSARVIFIFLYGMVELTIKRPRTRPERAAWLSVFCNRILRAANITYESHGPVPMEGGVISNHLNFTDILVHSAMRPCVFVSKAELRKVPVLGWISMMSGTQYVERGAGGSAQKAGEGMAKGFRDGLPIVFFPEGTTGTGVEPVMTFRSGLLAYTLDADQPITAAFIHYDVSAEDFAAGRTAQRDIFWGTQGMLNRLWAITGVKHAHITIHYAPEPIAFSEGALKNRKIAAVEAHDAVKALAVPLQS